MPLAVRIQFGHASAQRVADAHGIEILHIKGVTVPADIERSKSASTDADVIVHPDHARAYVRHLQAAGWRLDSRFELSSAFEHSATLWHEHWGWLDVHRRNPGCGPTPQEAFDVFWRDRKVLDLAGVACATPSRAGHILVLMLHAGRSPGAGPAQPDVANSWGREDETGRDAVRSLVEELDAYVGFAAALGTLESFRWHSDYPLWKVSAERTSRLAEWAARIRAAPRWRDKVRLVLVAPLVNVDHLAMVLGRSPTKAEIAREFVARPVRGARELLRRGSR